jgi:predicted acetyltransferase
MSFNMPIADDPARVYKVEPGYDTWGAVENGRLLSQIRAYDFAMNYHGTYQKMVGIGDVSSLVEARNRGNIRKLFAAIFEESRARGYVLSYLFPFSFAYYGKFGYSQGITRMQTQIPPALLAAYRCEYDVAMFRPGDDVAPYNAVFERFAAGYTGMVRRSNWKRLEDYIPHKNKRHMYLFTKNGEPQAYLGYIPERESEKDILRVQDFAWVDVAAMKQVLGFIGALRSHFEICEMKLPLDFPIEWLVDDPYSVERKSNQAGQVRILDVQAALAGYPWPEGEGSLVLGVRDDFFADNSGAYRVSYGHGGVEVTKTDTSPDLELDIRALNPLLFGVIGYPDLAFLPAGQAIIHGNREELARVFRRRPCYISEYF